MSYLARGRERQRADGYLHRRRLVSQFIRPAAADLVYAGRRFERFYGHDPLYLELTGGLLYGYLPPYDHKVPSNYRGFPGAVVALGWRLSPELSAQVNLLGNSALMFQLSADFNRGPQPVWQRGHRSGAASAFQAPECPTS